MIIKNLFSTMNISAEGLSVNRTKMNIIAENIANAETTRTETGEAYRRKIVQVHSGSADRKSFSEHMKDNNLDLTRTEKVHMPDDPFTYPYVDQKTGVHVSGIVKDPSAFRTVYDPTHPDANEQGYLNLPNINIVQEMVDMITASRSYEANVTTLNSSKDMIRNALKIGG